jgi:enolase-phosphatase E1
MATNVQAGTLLLDIEGTTTPIDYVYKVLFPYVRVHARDFLASHLDSEDLNEDIACFLRENLEDRQRGLDPPALADPPELDSLFAYVRWLMERDRKSTPLKSLQGKIWKEGYHRGELRSQVFEDVPVALERWQQEGKQICIFSSGSVLAQKLLFAHTEAGDLTRYIGGYFDTNMGAKFEPASYTRIAAALARDPAEVLFVSDVARELDAARSGGMQTRLCIRPGNPPQAEGSHGSIVSFDRI